jgi:hypothetical protein
MNETSCKQTSLHEIHQKPSLLERLRQQRVVVDPTTEKDARQKMNLIIEHRLEFPSNLREAIRESLGEEHSECQPEIFLSEVYKSVKAFFFGRSNRNNDESDDESKSTLQWWYGLDSDVDTEEEVELAIRLFPNLLTEEYFSFSSLNGCYPIYVSLMCLKALFFIPLLAELGVELGRFKEKERGGLTCFMKSVLFQLFCNVILRDDHDEESSGKLDEASTAILMRLKEKGLMKKEDIYQCDLANLLLYRALYKKTLRIEKRFKFLINWNPSILMECGQGNNLLNHYVCRLCRTNEGCLHPDTVQRFQAIVELGMYHFPAELGFVFHKPTFQLACENFGTKKVARIIDGEILRSLEQNNNTLNALVFAAATNDEISLDGVYILFRRDPIALLTEFTKSI